MKINKYQINGTTSSSDENTMNLLPHLINLTNVNTTQFTDTKIKIDPRSLNNIDKEFAEEMVYIILIFIFSNTIYVPKNEENL